MARKRVVVTGMGLVSCFGRDLDKFYDSLLEGKSGVVPIETFPCAEYPTRFAGEIRGFDPEPYVDKKHARRVPPFINYAIVAGKTALEQAGFTADGLNALDKTRCGIIIGSGMGGMGVFQEGVETLITKGFKRLTPFFVPYIITNMAGAMLAIDLGFKGPNYSISTACATASFSIQSAAQHIQRGEADLMICGGSESPITPIGLAGFVACRALSERNDAPEKASRPWDKDRDGFVMGEGSGVLVLESLEHAQARGATILAEYLGGATSCDANHITSPLEDGITLCVENALKDAGVSPDKIDYINAHATSTIAGDVCEIAVVKRVFGERAASIPINSTKSLVGHCLGAAGSIEIIAAIMGMNRGKLHPTINLDNPDEQTAGLDLVAGKAKEHKVDVLMKNSFGFGGHNASLIFAKYKN